MSRCIQLAKNGLGTTYPNPLVGSVIVYGDKIISEGWHQKPGLPHAEAEAIGNLVTDEGLLKKATLYVNLEPCSHFGKTPPCADLILSKGIKKVVIGSKDPNPKVAGNGIKKLQDAGCEVISGVLEDTCDELNKRFFTFHNKKRPYIFLKWAQTNDGLIAPNKENRKKNRPVWITNGFSRQLVHKMRGEEMSILIGTTTAMDDNPSLTVRDWAGPNPIRLLIDRDLKLPANATILDGNVKTYVFTAESKSKESTTGKTQYLQIDFSKEIASQICDALYAMEIQSLIVEGGARTHQTFIDANLWDEAVVFMGNKQFESGIPAPKLKGKLISETNLKEDRLQRFKNLDP